MAPMGATITVTSPDWRVEPGGTLEIDVRIDGRDLAEGQSFGGLTLDPDSTAHEIFLPVAFTAAPDPYGRTRAIRVEGPSVRPGLSAW